MNKAELANAVAEIFFTLEPSPKTELHFENEYQLAVAVMLSAQTTDKKVNQVTPELFKRYPSWSSLGNASVSDIIPIIRQVNFHKGKAERLVAAGKLVTATFHEELPHDIADLIKIPGIARKTANVIQQELWGRADGIVVDTHVSRVSQRLGLTANVDPKKIEADLMALLKEKYWRNYSGNCVLHGRYICTASKPKCDKCPLSNLCPSAFNVQ